MHTMISTFASYVISFCIALLVFLGLGSFLLWNRRRRRARSRKRPLPSPAELRRRNVPVIESVPFCVPPLLNNLVNIQVQPSIKSLPPLSSSTPTSPESPKVKFSIQYHRQNSQLVVQLLDVKHVSIGDSSNADSYNLEPGLSNSGSSSASSDSSNLFTTLPVPGNQQLQQQRRARQVSYAFEMSYEEIQLQSLQFCVMGYDQCSRHRVIGDVLLPLAELSQQGYDITRELVLWRDIQSRQPRNVASRRDTRQGSELELDTNSRCNQS